MFFFRFLIRKQRQTLIYVRGISLYRRQLYIFLAIARLLEKVCINRFFLSISKLKYQLIDNYRKTVATSSIENKKKLFEPKISLLKGVLFNCFSYLTLFVRNFSSYEACLFNLGQVDAKLAAIA